MTTHLKELMTEAVDAQAPYVPDLDALVRTGRRQVRRRRTTGVLATIAAVAVVAGATTVAVDTINRSSDVPVAPSTTGPSVGPDGSTGLCTTADGTPVPAWNRWTLVVYAQDDFGMSMVYRSPDDPKVVAFCTTQRGDGARQSVVPGGAVNGIVVRKNAVRELPGSSVTSVFGSVDSGPTGLAVVRVETADGHIGLAEVKDGYYVYRRLEHTPWPGAVPQVTVRFKYSGETLTWKINR
ncbi:hypothetical protein ABZX12_22625 [Kribbella sp. NPDC003505]|uniref:hypothetical protein n=1 Tax=Kribbella sp. NPDC003505 TaxID=3154448 RepID=UPI0033A30330